MKPNAQQTPKKAKKSILRTAARIALLCLIALTVGLGLYQFNAKAIGGNSMPMPFGVGMAVVISGSMEPTLSVNDLIIVTEADSYAERDIVVFTDGASLVVHRIIEEVDDETVITQGDNNNTDDGEILRENIKGKVVFSIPYVGILIDIIRSTPGTLAILLLAAYLYWRSIQTEHQEDEKEIDRIREEIERLKK